MFHVELIIIKQLVNRMSTGCEREMIAHPLATLPAMQQLIFDGSLDKLPGPEVPAAHGGGYLASYAPRSDHACFVGSIGCDPNIKLKKKRTEYLARNISTRWCSRRKPCVTSLHRSVPARSRAAATISIHRR